MAGTLCASLGGGLVARDQGTLIAKTTTAQPPSCNDPTMQLTVFDADYAGSGITWCGQTWTPAEVIAGATKTAVCPTDYIVQNTPSQLNIWEFSRAGTNNFPLRLRRGVDSASAQVATVTLSYNTTGAYVKKRDYYVCFFSFKLTSTNQLTGITFVAATHATANDYLINNAFFGSHTTTGGVQFSWAKDTGWP